MCASAGGGETAMMNLSAVGENVRFARALGVTRALWGQSSDGLHFATRNTDRTIRNATTAPKIVPGRFHQ